MNPITKFVHDVLRQRVQHPGPAISADAQRILQALEEGRRATMRPMPQPQEVRADER